MNRQQLNALLATHPQARAVNAARRRIAVMDLGATLAPHNLTAAEIALLHLRTDVLAGVPPAALVDRIDDELFKLRRKP